MQRRCLPPSASLYISLDSPADVQQKLLFWLLLAPISAIYFTGDKDIKILICFDRLKLIARELVPDVTFFWHPQIQKSLEHILYTWSLDCTRNLNIYFGDIT
ncbi:hypothetical protein GUJ93_ZPchr0004g39404 [Zizania palustris]|uniref:Uncharacterized protein n=1 Tax=Zizania palustris TaxID=103762 RepID=A0A8J5VNS3_ZIZPA|nr:hypothetical protein GUJ93_ZPchr0004g39404 [Zizania palustris]